MEYKILVIQVTKAIAAVHASFYDQVLHELICTMIVLLAIFSNRKCCKINYLRTFKPSSDSKGNAYKQLHVHGAAFLSEYD